METDKLLTLAEVAKILGVSRTTLYARAAQGLIPTINLTPFAPRATWRMRRSVLEAWLDKNTQKSGLKEDRLLKAVGK
jgi:excisionase family DNA binding protein